MRMPLSCFPPDAIGKYSLDAISVNDWVCIEIRKGMYHGCGHTKHGQSWYHLLLMTLRSHMLMKKTIII
jgi:hypothetical protein